MGNPIVPISPSTTERAKLVGRGARNIGENEVPLGKVSPLPERQAEANKTQQGMSDAEVHKAASMHMRGGAPTMHTGGTVPEDGVYTLQAGEHVIPKGLAKHGFHRTSIEHHHDGSATIKHEHHTGAHVEHAVMDLDGIHDSLEKHLRDPQEIEDEIKKRGVDPEKLEEIVEPGLHDKALDYEGEKHGFKPDDAEEEVSPGVHEKMARLLSKS